MYTVMQAKQDHRQAHQAYLDHLDWAVVSKQCSCSGGRPCREAVELCQDADAAGRRWEALEGRC